MAACHTISDLIVLYLLLIKLESALNHLDINSLTLYYIIFISQIRVLYNNKFIVY